MRQMGSQLQYTHVRRFSLLEEIYYSVGLACSAHIDARLSLDTQHESSGNLIGGRITSTPKMAGEPRPESYHTWDHFQLACGKTLVGLFARCDHFRTVKKQ
jgi:hypothetical protein